LGRTVGEGPYQKRQVRQYKVLSEKHSRETGGLHEKDKHRNKFRNFSLKKKDGNLSRKRRREQDNTNDELAFKKNLSKCVRKGQEVRGDRDQSDRVNTMEGSKEKGRKEVAGNAEFGMPAAPEKSW